VCQRTKNASVPDLWANQRDVERLDFSAVTDHGYNMDRPQWQYTSGQVRAHHDPGVFVTFLGEEWTSDLKPDGKLTGPARYGHHNLIFLDPYHPHYYDAHDGDVTPTQLWEEHGDAQVLTIPHQLADTGNVPTDWRYHDDVRQPVAEIFQQRGSYEALGAPLQARRSQEVKGNFLQDAWARPGAPHVRHHGSEDRRVVRVGRCDDGRRGRADGRWAARVPRPRHGRPHDREGARDPQQPGRARGAAGRQHARPRVDRPRPARRAAPVVLRARAPRRRPHGVVEPDLVRPEGGVMTTDRKATLQLVRDGLAAVWDSKGRKFVTFEAETSRSEAPELWVQYLDGELNLSWPEDDDPRTTLPRRGVTLPAGAFVTFHTPLGSAQIAVGDVVLDDVASLILELFERVLASATAFELTSRVEDHA
jgi:hypothetical protein